MSVCSLVSIYCSKSKYFYERAVMSYKFSIHLPKQLEELYDSDVQDLLTNDGGEGGQLMKEM